MASRQINGHVNKLGRPNKKDSSDLDWAGNNAMNAINKQSELVPSLISVKHDHPLVISGLKSKNNKMMLNNCSGNGNNDGLLIGSLPPSFSNTNMMDDELNRNGGVGGNGLPGFPDLKSPSCLPFGLCYGSNNHLNDYMTNADYNDMMPYTRGKFYDYDETGCPVYNDNFPSYRVEDAFQNKPDYGPTLAELNFPNENIWDNIDLDDIISLGSEKNVKYNQNYERGKIEDDDPKLQENIDYLTSILVGISSTTNAISINRPTKQVELEDNVIGKLPPVHENQIKSEPDGNVGMQVRVEESKNHIESGAGYFLPNKMEKVRLQHHPIKMEVDEKKKPLSQNSLPSALPLNVVNQTTEFQEILSSSRSIKTRSMSPLPSVVGKRPRNDSISSTISNSHSIPSEPEKQDEYDTDEFDNFDDSDDEELNQKYKDYNFEGEATSDDLNNKWGLDMGRTRKGSQQRYFWQYNVQSKGPKGTRISAIGDSNNDPYTEVEAKDPVFSSDCHIEGVKHAGKARKGDGNDLTPNPKKLLMIGLELKKLSRTINELTPVAEVPPAARSYSRKEKNKLASRACRLKKKAQHEANKIKLYGLQQEHKKMLNVVSKLRKMVNEGNMNKRKGSLRAAYDEIIKEILPNEQVSGRSAEYVNCELDLITSPSARISAVNSKQLLK